VQYYEQMSDSGSVCCGHISSWIVGGGIWVEVAPLRARARDKKAQFADP